MPWPAGEKDDVDPSMRGGWREDGCGAVEKFATASNTAMPLLIAQQYACAKACCGTMMVSDWTVPRAVVFRRESPTPNDNHGDSNTIHNY